MKKIISLVSLLSLLSNVGVTAFAQEIDVSNYEQIYDYTYMNPEVKESDVDMLSIPYYGFGQLTAEEIIKRVEEEFGESAEYMEYEENRAPNYSLHDSGIDFQTFNYDNPNAYSEKSPSISFDFYNNDTRFGFPHGSLVNWFIDFHSWYGDELPIANEPLEFMTFEEAEAEIKRLVNVFFGIEELELVTRSITDEELQNFIDYQNLNKLKPNAKDFTDEIPAVYFGKIIPYIGDYPILAGKTGGSENIYPLTAEYSISESGLEHLTFLGYVPIGEEAGHYSEVKDYEEILQVSKEYLDVDQKNPLNSRTQYLQDISVVYMPLHQKDLQAEGYFPVWQVTVVSDDEGSIPYYFYINPVSGEVI